MRTACNVRVAECDPLVRPVVDALDDVFYRARVLSGHCRYIGRSLALYSPPRPEDWPGSEACRRDDQARENIVAAFQIDEPGITLAPKFWPSVITELTECFAAYHAAIETAVAVVDTHARLLDVADSAIHLRTSSVIISKLHSLGGCYSPGRCGKDGLAIVRYGLCDLPSGFEQVERELLELYDVVRRHKPQPPRQPDGWLFTTVRKEADVAARTLNRWCENAGARTAKPGDSAFSLTIADIKKLIRFAEKGATQRQRNAATRLKALIGQD